nr:hypothetical protein [Candidatus Freyarchaeota archaeon]
MIIKRHGYKTWAERVGFGRRWAVETAIDPFEALFGDYAAARAIQSAQREVGLRVELYNQLC